jgi:hypothetical protein
MPWYANKYSVVDWFASTCAASLLQLHQFTQHTVLLFVEYSNFSRVNQMIQENDGFVHSSKAFIQNWLGDQIFILIRLLLRVISPILQLLSVVIMIIVLSTFMYLIAFRRWVPKAFVNEPVYFDYSTQPIVAHVSFSGLNYQQQYTQVNSKGMAKNDEVPFLKHGRFYSVDMSISLAKSNKNFLLGSSALTLTVIDASGEATARSTRPLVMPYQSAPSLWIESVALQPFRLCGLIQTTEFVTVHIPLMNNYQEPAPHRPHTNLLELSLSLDSATQMDILDAHITVLPRVTGLV